VQNELETIGQQVLEHQLDVLRRCAALATMSKRSRSRQFGRRMLSPSMGAPSGSCRAG
jgi:hypothetical protein